MNAIDHEYFIHILIIFLINTDLLYSLFRVEAEAEKEKKKNDCR